MFVSVAPTTAQSSEHLRILVGAVNVVALFSIVIVSEQIRVHLKRKEATLID